MSIRENAQAGLLRCVVSVLLDSYGGCKRLMSVLTR